MSKAPADRPQSYADIAAALRPFARADQLVPRLGVRVLAGVVDYMSIVFPLTLVDTVRAFAGAGDLPSFTSHGIARNAWLFLALYYVLVEGTTGASPGKRLFGLRLVSATGPPPFSRALVRAAIFAVPGVVLFAFGAWQGPLVVSAVGTLRAGLERPVIMWVFVALLFATARRRNGWSGIHDLATGTRVISYSAPSRRRAGQTARPARVSGAHQQLGPFVFVRDLGVTGRGGLIEAIDSVLRRDVWIHQVSADTPAASPARRDVSRVTRLHWLMGPRAGTAWDAFDAPAGRPLLAVNEPVDWPTLRGWLVDLSDELTHIDRDGTLASATLAHVWVRDDGHLTLLDFPYPTADQNRAHAATDLRPIDLIAAVATYATTRAPHAGRYPLGLLRRVDEWRTSPPTDVQALRTQVTTLAQTPDEVTSMRRAVPMLFPLLPILGVTATVVVSAPSMLTMRTFEHASMLWWLDALRASPPEGRLRDPEVRDAAERYVVERFRASLGDDGFWNTVTMQAASQSARHALARQLLERHGQTSGDLGALAARLRPEVALADRQSHAVADHAGGFVGLIASSSLALVIVVSMIAQLMSALVVPGGLVMRAAGTAIVTTHGREVSRLRSLGRALLIWSPALVWSLVLALSVRGADNVPLPRWPMLGAVLTIGALAIGAIATILKPSRGPQDVLTNVWVVPR